MSLPPNSPMRAGASSFSIRRARPRSAARRSGRSADCSSSTRRSSAACASATRRELALQDWLGSAGFDRDEDHWPRRWAEAYVDFAAGEKRAWLRQQGLKIFPIVGWAERGGYLATGHGNSVPRFHVTWGTGPGVIEPFVRRVREAESRGLVSFRFRHRVTAIDQDRRRDRRRAGRCAGAEQCGARQRKLAPRSPARSRCARRRSSSRRAASAAITSWCGAIGRSGWASRRAT